MRGLVFAVLLGLSFYTLADIATGRVFVDANQNGLLDSGETGLPNVRVSNGTKVVLTNENGRKKKTSIFKCHFFFIFARGN